MQQLIRLSTPIAAAGAVTTSLVLANRRNASADRVKAMLQPILKAGAVALTRDELVYLQQSVMVRWWLDANQQQAFCNQPIPVSECTAGVMGPLPVKPFTLKETDQFTLEVSATSGLIFTDAASPYVVKLSSLNVVLILYGNDDRHA